MKGYGVAYMSLSRTFVKNFPYVIYFKPNPARNGIVIYAVLNEKQNRDDILSQRA
jgi:hypothetical protein